MTCADTTILKAASATAFYGPEGINEAIVVTTKRGSKTRPSITIGHTVQIETVSFMPKLQTRFGSGSSVDQIGFGVYDPIENQRYGDEFDGSLRDIGKPLPDGSTVQVPYQYVKDGRRNFFQTGVTLQNDISYGAKNFIYVYTGCQN